MNVQVDLWLRGEDFATTRPIVGVTRDPPSWTDEDVRTVLEGMLRVMHDLKHPGAGPTAQGKPAGANGASSLLTHRSVLTRPGFSEHGNARPIGDLTSMVWYKLGRKCAAGALAHPIEIRIPRG